MADEDNAPDSAPSEEGGKPEKGGKKNKKLIMIIGGVVLLLAAGGGAFMFMGGDEEEAAMQPTAEAEGQEEAQPKVEDSDVAEGDGEGEGEDEADGGNDEPKSLREKIAAAKKADEVNLDIGCMYTMKPFQMNLGNPLESRFLRLEIAVEFKCTKEGEEEIKRRIPQLRDAILSVSSRKTREFLLGPDGKMQLRREILNRINQFLTNKIDDVYIADMLIE